MDLLHNPFYILGATTQDNRRRIMQLAEEKSLLGDAEQCQDARSILTNPRKRISAEVAWLPGVEPDKIDELLKQLEPPNQQLLNVVGLTPIARANLFVAGLSPFSNLSSANVVKWILAIAQAAESVNPEDVLTILNKERSTSSFPEITDLSAITEAIQDQKRYYPRVLNAILEKLIVTNRARVVTQSIEIATNNLKTKCPSLIEDLISAYEGSIVGTLEKKQDIIEAHDEKLRAEVDAENSNTVLEPIVNQLIGAVKDWDSIAQPIQLSKKIRGERHAPSFEIAWQVRKLAVDLFKDYNKLNFSQQIINMLKEVFAEVIEVHERLTEDLEALQEHEADARGFEAFKKIEALAKQLKTDSDARKSDYILESTVTELISHVKNWDTSTQITDANNIVALVVRNIALHLWNQHQKLDLAMQITNTLNEVFVSNGCVSLEVSTQLSADKKALDELNIQRKLIGAQRKLIEAQRPSTGCMLQIVFGIIGIIAFLLQGC